jgi:hypothetical protein
MRTFYISKTALTILLILVHILAFYNKELDREDEIFLAPHRAA